MALPIRETPILHGEDARRFVENAKKAWTNPVPREEYERAKKTYEEMSKKRKLDFQF